jgi:hypothetical protein
MVRATPRVLNVRTDSKYSTRIGSKKSSEPISVYGRFHISFNMHVNIEKLDSIFYLFCYCFDVIRRDRRAFICSLFFITLMKCSVRILEIQIDAGQTNPTKKIALQNSVLTTRSKHSHHFSKIYFDQNILRLTEIDT